MDKVSGTKPSGVTAGRVRTPCIGVCSTGIGDAVCRGCKRFSHEVIDWNAYTEAEKAIVDQRLANFLSTCMQNKFTVTDSGLLRWQLETQQVRFNPMHDQYCGLFALLKAGASQISDTDAFGFSVHAPWRSHSLRELFEMVDYEFWSLSDAHHERYLATADLFSES
jgi:predicted Fe-S protein YdhL (DUF1289 family)